MSYCSLSVGACLGPVDCVLSGWSGWSSCNARCGTGIKQRRRSVDVHPQNGGRPCSTPLVEKAVCEGTACKQPRAYSGTQDPLKGTLIAWASAHRGKLGQLTYNKEQFSMFMLYFDSNHQGRQV